MTLEAYWPSDDADHIGSCIQTEAEELREAVLLAVHEPMQLVRKGGGADLICTEAEVLDHLLAVDRPIPIIGESGVGKSHLIRWLEARLRMRPESEGWHIVRIPKNASLRQVLSLLLEGLDGEDFDLARRRVTEVGEALSTELLAKQLLVFMEDQLKHLAASVRKMPAQDPASEEGRRAREIAQHSGPTGLGALILDPVFSSSALIGDGKCISTLAARMARGASNDELTKQSYEIQPTDLDFQLNLQNLSLPARQYVQSVQLKTKPEARQAAARVLNEVIGESTRAAFRTLFQFNSGSFQDLFKQIRRSLNGRTLVILVEDMAAISAIEDVLIDSLVEERGKDGREELCVLRSAIAVTSGHEGYRRRQATIATRAVYEWWIQDYRPREDQILSRIESLCSRYLNAARHGVVNLERLGREGRLGQVPIWRNEDVDRRTLEAFGLAKGTAIPLFPYNRSAIRVLARAISGTVGGVTFNPRKVLNHVLLAVLKSQRKDWEVGSFPVPNLFRIDPPATLAEQLRNAGLRDPLDRVLTFAAVWGDGAQDLVGFARQVPAEVPDAFALPGLAALLRKVGVGQEPEEVRDPEEKDEEQKQKPLRIATPDERKVQAIQEAVEAWCSCKKLLDQGHARELRNALMGLYNEAANSDLNYATHPALVGSKRLPPIGSGLRIKVSLPSSATANLADGIPFCQEKDFKKPEARIEVQSATIALLRHAYFNSDSKKAQWNYPDGFEDYVRIRNFAARWIPSVLEELLSREREQLGKKILGQVECARLVGAFIGVDTHQDRLGRLLQSADSVRDGFRSTITFPEEAGIARDQALVNWQGLQDAWLDWVVPGRRTGLDGDVVLKALREALGQPVSTQFQRSVETVRRKISTTDIFQLDELSKAGGRAADLADLLRDMAKVVGEIRNAGKGEESQGMNTGQIQSTLEALADAPVWSDLSGFLQAMSPETEATQAWAGLLKVDGTIIKRLSEVLKAWNLLAQETQAKLDRENRENAAEEVQSHLNQVSQVLEMLDSGIKALLEAKS